MQTETSNKPLYKVLDKERTTGEWNVYLSEKGKDGCSRAYINSALPNDIYETICTMSGLKGNEAGAIAKINAAYIILAVNNLSQLADALQAFVDYLDSDLSEAETILLEQAKEALARIS